MSLSVDCQQNLLVRLGYVAKVCLYGEKMVILQGGLGWSCIEEHKKLFIY